MRHALLIAALVATPGTVLSAQQSAEERDEDGRLAGYLQAILEREFGWEPGTFELSVRNRVATVLISGADRSEREPQLLRLVSIEGLERLEVLDSDELRVSAPAVPVSGGVSDWLGLSQQDIAYPSGDVFEPLIADPKTLRFFASLRHYDLPDDGTTGGAIGFGETFGLWKRAGLRSGDGLQLGIAAGIFAQFDLETSSTNLINSDYIVGAPLTWRSGRHSARLRLYHQSSHLGDEFVLTATTDRVNLSFESLELLYSFDWAQWRAYGGGEYLVSREPGDLDRLGGHCGLEFRGERHMLGGTPLAGLDLKSWEGHSGAIDAALSFGIELENGTSGRSTRWMVELYNGYSPHGQFFDDRIWFAGFGLQLEF